MPSAITAVMIGGIITCIIQILLKFRKLIEQAVCSQPPENLIQRAGNCPLPFCGLPFWKDKFLQSQ